MLTSVGEGKSLEHSIGVKRPLGQVGSAVFVLQQPEEEGFVFDCDAQDWGEGDDGGKCKFKFDPWSDVETYCECKLADQSSRLFKDFKDGAETVLAKTNLLRR